MKNKEKLEAIIAGLIIITKIND